MLKISDSWFVIDEIFQDFLGERNPINIAFYRSKKGLIMIDTGIKGSLGTIEKSLSELGLSFQQITCLIITHYHGDHIGNINFIHEKYPLIRIFAHPKEIPYIKGQEESFKPLINYDEIKELFPNVTDADLKALEKTSFRECFNGNIEPILETEVSASHFPLVVLDTPGHTPGHISVYDPREKVLVAGDLAMFWKGRLWGPVASFSSNYDQAEKSFEKVLRLDIRVLVGYHGQVYRGKPRPIRN